MSDDKEPQHEQPEELTDLQREKLSKAMRALKERLAGQPRPCYVKPDPAPVYDEIFEKGVAALDQDGGEQPAFPRTPSPPDLTTEREQTQTLLDRVGSFDVSHSTERELLSVIRKLCECMIDDGLGEDE